jgi:hypothetical protein
MLDATACMESPRLDECAAENDSDSLAHALAGATHEAGNGDARLCR